MTREEVLAVVAKNLKLAVPGLDEVEFKPESTYGDLGVTSLDLVEAMTASMREMNVKIPIPELAKAKDAGGLVELLFLAQN